MSEGPFLYAILGLLLRRRLALTCLTGCSISADIGISNTCAGLIGLFADGLEDDITNYKNSNNKECND